MSTRDLSRPGVVDVDGLTRRFGPTLAVRPVRTRIGPGGITGLLGPNGSGKSTLLRMLVGLVRPDAGTAHLDGVRLAGDGTAVRRRVAYMPGETAVYRELRGRDHLIWLLRGRGREEKTRAVAIATELGLPLERRVRGYSHGMKRQLFLAAVLAPRVNVRVLDEPTEGLDPTKRSEVLTLLQQEAEEGTTILLSSHHLGEVDRACDQMLFLRNGELLDREAADALQRRARRVLRLAWSSAPAAAEVEGLQTSLRRLGVEEVRLDGPRAVLFLPEGDPRAVLLRVLQSPDVPEPESIVFGELPLSELYRELYGAEGI